MLLRRCCGRVVYCLYMGESGSDAEPMDTGDSSDPEVTERTSDLGSGAERMEVRHVCTHTGTHAHTHTDGRVPCLYAL